MKMRRGEWLDSEGCEVEGYSRLLSLLPGPTDAPEGDRIPPNAPSCQPNLVIEQVARAILFDSVTTHGNLTKIVTSPSPRLGPSQALDSTGTAGKSVFFSAMQGVNLD